MQWFTAGALTNPAAGAVLATTGKLPGPSGANLTFLLSTTASTNVTLEYVNAADVVQGSQRINCIVGAGPLIMTFPCNWIPNDEFRIRQGSALTGSIQASIVRE